MTAATHVLIVDDNPANLKLLELVLRGRGYVIHCAHGAEEAAAVIGRVVPSIILMDLQLPGIDGLTLTRRLKADPRTRDVPIVAITSHAMKGDEERARAAGCNGYITKPIDTRTLPVIIADHLARRA